MQAFTAAWKAAGAAEKDAGSTLNALHTSFQQRGEALAALAVIQLVDEAPLLLGAIQGHAGMLVCLAAPNQQ